MSCQAADADPGTEVPEVLKKAINDIRPLVDLADFSCLPNDWVADFGAGDDAFAACLTSSCLAFSAKAYWLSRSVRSH